MPYLPQTRDVAAIKETLSSWDKCMAKSYCKWPVIVAIIVGSLIIISLLVCLARCICCGAKCACCCFKCCAGCCSGRKGHKRMGSAAVPPPAPIYSSDTPYRSHPAPAYTPVHTTGIIPARAPAPERPQFAQFDASTGKPIHEDSLPHMPSWREASSKKIEVEEMVDPEKPGDVEMNRFGNNGSTPSAGFDAVADTSPRSPTRPLLQQSPSQERFGAHGSYQQNDSFLRAAPKQSHYGLGAPSGRGQQQEGYRGLSPVHALSIPTTFGTPYGRSSPNPAYNQSGRTQNRSPVSPLLDRGYGAPPIGQAIDMPSPRIYQTGAGAPASHSVRSNSPGYDPSGATRHEPSGVGNSSQQSYPGQQTYRAFQPTTHELDSRDLNGLHRKPLNGSWKDV